MKAETRLGYGQQGLTIRWDMCCKFIKVEELWGYMWLGYYVFYTAECYFVCQVTLRVLCSSKQQLHNGLWLQVQMS